MGNILNCSKGNKIPNTSGNQLSNLGNPEGLKNPANTYVMNLNDIKNNDDPPTKSSIKQKLCIIIPIVAAIVIAAVVVIIIIAKKKPQKKKPGKVDPIIIQNSTETNSTTTPTVPITPNTHEPSIPTTVPKIIPSSSETTKEPSTSVGEQLTPFNTEFIFRNVPNDLKSVSVVQTSNDQSKFNNQLITTDIKRETNYHIFFLLFD